MAWLEEVGTETPFCYQREVSMEREQRRRTMDGDQKKKKWKGRERSKVEEQRGRIKEEESIQMIFLFLENQSL